MRKVPEVIAQADKLVSVTLTNMQWYNILNANYTRVLNHWQSHSEIMHRHRLANIRSCEYCRQYETIAAKFLRALDMFNA